METNGKKAYVFCFGYLTNQSLFTPEKKIKIFLIQRI